MTVTEKGPAARGASAWIRTFQPRPERAARLVCFPHAGGAAKAFTGLAAALPPDVELAAVQYPGRQDRYAEPCAADVGELAAGAAGALAGHGGVPLFLLGHSMGALVAFETARALAARGTVPRVFVSAARPPSHDWDEPDVDALADAAVLGELRRLGGVPEPLLADPDSAREILRVLRADHRALRRYVGAVDTAVDVPLTVLLGDTDPKNTLEQMRDWARHTTAGHGVEMLPGGHFALLERPADVVPVLTRHIRADLANRADPAAGAVGRAGTADAGRPARPAPAELIREILVGGLAGRRPPLPTDLTRLEAAARAALPPDAFGYAAGDAGTGATGRANREAFGRWRLLPRMLRGTGPRDLSVPLLGERLPAPVLLAPIAAQAVVHPEGEPATVRAAAGADVPFVLSAFASCSLEEAAKEAGPGPRWFQLYMPADRAVAESLVRRAEASGYTALVLTVDAPNFGYRPADLDAAYSPFLRGTGIANFTGDPAFLRSLPAGADARATVAQWARVSTDPALTWDGLPWLRELTDLPILVKGLLHPGDARLALERGADGVVVSNHGGRQLDGSVAALDALPAVRAAVGEGVPVLLDSGVRTGTDVVKALALGADAVLYGRPYLYGLALGGQEGVEHVLRCLLAEVDLALGLSGCASAADVTADLVVPPGPVAGERR